jgi:hypothetical protein
MSDHLSSKYSCVLFAALLLVGSSGCALVAVGAGGAAGYAYASGRHEKIYPYPLDQTWAAVRDAVQELQLPVETERSDALSARLESHLATGEKVTITLEPKTPGLTEVRIRVGTFGDHVTSRMVFDRIDSRLPGPYPAPPPKPEVHVGVSVSR